MIRHYTTKAPKSQVYGYILAMAKEIRICYNKDSKAWMWAIWDGDCLLDDGLEEEISDAFEVARFILENDDEI